VARSRGLGRLVRLHPLGVFGGVVLLAMTVAAIFAPWLAPYNPLDTDYSQLIRSPSLAHPLGTDHFGRDVLSRLIFGARTALLVGLLSSVVSATLGAALGVTTAYFGGTIDLLAQRLTDILLSFPLIVLAIAVVAVVGTGTLPVILAIIVPMVPRATRVVRASALAVCQQPYVEAAHGLGLGHLRIIGRHLVPNVMAPYLVMLTAFLAEVIVLEASLSFLGLGVVEPTAAWGLMLRDFAGQYAERAPWLPLAPGAAISLAVFGFNLLGDAVRDALDPRLRH
jgi:peptide/nickel transport system permease protein